MSDNECVICGGRGSDARAVLVGQEWPICAGCSLLLGRARQLGAAPAFGQCLHLAACEAEQVAMQRSRRAVGGGESRYRRIGRSLSEGAQRRCCPCATCRAVERGDFRRAPARRSGLVSAGLVNVDEIPVPALRALPRDMRVQSDLPGLDRVGDWVRVGQVLESRLNANAVATARPRVERGSLSAHALFAVADRRDSARSALVDRLSRIYWRDMEENPGEAEFIGLCHYARLRPWLHVFPDLHPPEGYYDGPYWVDAFGECHVLPRVMQ